MRVLLDRAADLAKRYPQETAKIPTMSVDHLRACFNDTVSLLGEPPMLKRTPLNVSIDLHGRSLKARLYVPDVVASDKLVVYFHGGGWVMGGLETHDHLLRYICQKLGASILHVRYRLAPEHAYDAIVSDAIDAVIWIHDNLERFHCGSLATAGDSSGAYLAAIAAAKNGALVKTTLLLYPVVAQNFLTNSYLHRGNGPGLTADMMRWYWHQFTNQQVVIESGQVAAGLFSHSFDSGPESVTIVTAWHDPLYDEGREYAGHLRGSSKLVNECTAFDMPHGFARYWAVNSRAKIHLDHALHDFSKHLT